MRVFTKNFGVSYPHGESSYGRTRLRNLLSPFEVTRHPDPVPYPICGIDCHHHLTLCHFSVWIPSLLYGEAPQRRQSNVNNHQLLLLIVFGNVCVLDSMCIWFTSNTIILSIFENKNKIGFCWLQYVFIRRFLIRFVRYGITFLYPNHLKLGTDLYRGLMNELNLVLFVCILLSYGNHITVVL